MDKKDRNEVVNALLMILQISISMLVPILFCTIGGAKLDEWLGTNWIAIVGFIIGAVAGIQSVYRLVKRYLK